MKYLGGGGGVALFFALLVALASVFGVVIAGNEVSKENHVASDNELTAAESGKAVQVDAAESFSSIWDAPALAADLLPKLDVVACVVDVRGSCRNRAQATARRGTRATRSATPRTR